MCAPALADSAWPRWTGAGATKPSRAACFRARAARSATPPPEPQRSAEEIEGRAPDERGCGARLPRRVADAADDRRRDAAVLLHHEPRGRRDFVGERDDRVMERPAGQVGAAAEVEQRLHPGAPEGDLDEPLAPGPPERVCDDDRQLDAEARPQPLRERR